MLWNWLRTRVRESILAGVEDAVADLSQGEADANHGSAAQQLLARLQAVPAIEAEGNAVRKGRKPAA